MSKADNKALAELHGELTRVLVKAVKADYTSEDNPKGVPPAAILNVARQMLKDNFIAADTSKNDGLKELADSLPTFDPEEDEKHMRH